MIRMKYERRGGKDGGEELDCRAVVVGMGIEELGGYPPDPPYAALCTAGTLALSRLCSRPYCCLRRQ